MARNEKGQFIKGQKPWNTGKKRPPFSEEWKRKLGLSRIGNKNSLGNKASEETRKKISEGHKGLIPWNKGKKGLYKHTPETLKKISEAHKGKYYGQGFKKGNTINVGSRRTDETKRKMSLSATGKNHDYAKGDKNHNWKGGKSFEIYPQDWSKTLKKAIRERDHYTCQMCKSSQDIREFSIHHIDYNKKNCDPKNLITLCVKCHTKTNYKREKWLEYFKSL